MPRALLACFLGLFSPFVFILGASPFEVVGKNSVREIVAGSIAVALYLAVCQYMLARKVGRGLRGNLPTLLVMDSALLLMVVVIGSLESHRVLLAQGVPMLLSGCVGSLAGAVLAARRAVVVRA